MSIGTLNKNKRHNLFTEIFNVDLIEVIGKPRNKTCLCFILSSLIHISIVTVRKWLLRSVRTCVCEEVGLEVGPLVEAPLTDGTPVGRLLVVKDLVDCECSGLAETLPAV